MKEEIRIWIEKYFNKTKEKNLCKKFAFIVSSIVFFLSMYFLTIPAIALSNPQNYTLSLKDNYEYSWKKTGYTTSYDLNLIFTDTNGNMIEGRNVNIEIGEGKLEDDPYAFGYVPLKNTTINELRGKDLIEVLDLKEYITSTGEKYKFDHAEVYINNTWQKLTGEGIRWHIWCQNASSQTEPANKNYGWRGKYGDNETNYTITNDTEYKFVYQLVRYGNDKTVTSLGAESGIKFQLFNYFGDNEETGINNNGIYNYFTFRDSSKEKPTKINTEIDGDGFKDNRAKVLAKLDEEGYPIFDCQGKCSSNPSLGYLFGSTISPKGTTPIGVESYQPINTLLQKETIEGVEYYYYDSNQNAVDYDTDNNQFLVRDYVERAYSMSTYEKEKDRYEFLPFDYLNNLEQVKTNSITNLTYQYEQVDKDSWYGMTMEFEFYMPKNGMIKNKDMIFSFSGDDDVWVFIDDVLVLDLGGTHGAVDGNINFRTGEVESYLNWNGINNQINASKTTIYEAYTNANSTNDIKWQEIATEVKTTKIFENYTKHTLKFFYLERGAAVANCKIRFNIPVLPKGSLSIQKQFDMIDRYNDTYEFTLYDITSNAAVANTEYTIGENKFTTDEFGNFKLKNTEIATFQLLNEHTYYVEETNTGSHAVSYQCSFDGTDCPKNNKTPEFTMSPDSSYQAVFTNKPKNYDLEISKIAYDSDDNETFEFMVQLKYSDGTKEGILKDVQSLNLYEVDEINGTINFFLKNEEKIIINGIPDGALVTLIETNHDGYSTIMKEGDITLADGATYEFTMDSNKNITVYNIPGVTLPETGGSGIHFYLIIGTCLLFICFKYKHHKFLIRKEGG